MPQPSIAAGSFAPLETGWTRASGAEPPGPGTEREMAVELFHPPPAGSGSAPGETSPPWLGTCLSSGMGRGENGSLQGVCRQLPSLSEWSRRDGSSLLQPGQAPPICSCKVGGGCEQQLCPGRVTQSSLAVLGSARERVCAQG